MNILDKQQKHELPIGSTMKEKISNVLAKPVLAPIVLILATYFSSFDRNYGYFFGLFFVLFLLWKSRFNWSEFGLGQKISVKTVYQSLLISIGFFIGMDVFIQPFLEIYFGAIDLSSLDEIRGNFISYFIMIIIMWVFAAVGEELLFHGYYMKRIARLLGDTNKAWLISAIFISIYFGVSHAYQGPAGMIAVGIVGFWSAIIFYKNRENLILLIMVHGFYDMIGLTLIYFDQETFILDWIQQRI